MDSTLKTQNSQRPHHADPTQHHSHHDRRPGLGGHRLQRPPRVANSALGPAGEGVRFDRFYAAAPVCSPTRGSCITGRHPYRYGIFFANIGHLPAEEITLAEALKTQGYATGHFGKWHIGTLTTEIQDGRRGGREDQRQHYSPPWKNGFDECFSTEVAVPTWDPMREPTRPCKYWTGPGEWATDNLEGDDSMLWFCADNGPAGEGGGCAQHPGGRQQGSPAPKVHGAAPAPCPPASGRRQLLPKGRRMRPTTDAKPFVGRYPFGRMRTAFSWISYCSPAARQT